MIKPYNITESKKLQVETMFDNIAPKYDFLNHLLSLNTDKLWRKKVRKNLKNIKSGIFLDLATGTADLAIELSKLEPEKIYGTDLSEKMLLKGEEKVKKKNLEKIISLEKGDAENIRFENCFFDAVTIAFGIRNFENPENGLNEIYRVLKDKGILIILEFTEPKNFLLKKGYNLYFSKILPYIGKFFSKDFLAYKYLPESVKSFPQREFFIEKILSAGFKNASFKNLSFGIAAIYIAYK